MLELPPSSAVAGVEPVGEDVFFDADERLASGGSGALTPRGSSRSGAGGTPDSGAGGQRGERSTPAASHSWVAAAVVLRCGLALLRTFLEAAQLAPSQPHSALPLPPGPPPAGPAAPPPPAAAPSKDLAEFTFKLRQPGGPEWEGVDSSLDVSLRWASMLC